MCRKLSFLLCIALLLAGSNIVLGQNVWEGRIEDSMDAVEDQLGRGMYSTSSDLEFPNDGGLQVVGLRFETVLVPPGATISNAYIVFTVDEVEGNNPANLVIDAELNPFPADFGSSGFDVENRVRTTAKAYWSPEHYPATGQEHQTSDISAVIEEVVGQAGWASGGSIVIIIYDNPDNPSTGIRTVETGGSQGPLLHVEYTLGNAGNPNPGNGEIDVSRDTDLSWSAGVFAAATNAHTVFFGTSSNDISAGIGGTTQSATTYDPGRLEFGTTYYWRIDENNGPPDFGKNEGSVWSFTTELYSYPIDGATITATASSEGQATFGPANTIDGSGLDENDLHSTLAEDMWLSDNEPSGAWIQYEFDKVYKLHEMWVWNSNQVFEPLFGFGFKDVVVEVSNNGTDWTTIADTPQFTKASGMSGYAHDTTVDFGGAAAKFVKLTASSNWGGILPQYSLSEVRFFYVPVNPSAPSPSSGATNVDVVDATLSWKAGREAVTHQVYVSTDEQAVADGTAQAASAATSSFTPPALDLSTTYYWKVSEANEAETPSTWESGVWSLTTSDHVVVDDFESYNDYPPNEIYMTWVDGYEIPGNGSQVGNLSPPLAETVIVHGGMNSMPLFYSNTGGATYSEGTRTFAAPQNWTQHGVTMLVIWFQGTPGNTGQMYAKINGTKIAYNGAAGTTAIAAWQPWSIDLAASGASLQSVNSLSVGVDGNGAAGTLYFDDIGLYVVAPEPINEWSIANDDEDDAEERIGPNNGAMDRGSSDLEMPYEDPGKVDPQIVGVRFTGIPIPQGATITDAWVQFTVDETKGGTDPVNLIIQGELSTSPAGFGSAAGNISSRTTTAAQVQWSVPNWVNVGDAGPDQRTPNIASIIQEIVNQPGWAGAGIVLIIKDNPANPSTGIRCAEAGPGGDSALLHIDYQ